MMSLTIITGPAGSGKSRLANQMKGKNNRVVVVEEVKKFDFNEPRFLGKDVIIILSPNVEAPNVISNINTGQGFNEQK